jgi:hypothetical protein
MIRSLAGMQPASIYSHESDGDAEGVKGSAKEVGNVFFDLRPLASDI